MNRRGPRVGDSRDREVPGDAARALAALHDFAPPHRPYVSYGFLALSLAITIPTLIHPDLYDVFGGLEPRRYPWQVITAVFEHGWLGFHGSLHLALNAFLILECGRPCERLLGWRRFLTLSLAAVAGNAVAQLLTQGVNGSSLVIWAWGPPLYLALRRAAGWDPKVRGDVHYERIRLILVVMYVVVVIAMGAIPYLSGWRGSPVLALAMGNLYHLVAAGVGLVFTLAWSPLIESRLVDLRAPRARPSAYDGASARPGGCRGVACRRLAVTRAWRFRWPLLTSVLTQEGGQISPRRSAPRT